MSNSKRVNVSVRRTVNLGDFNSMSVEIGLEEDVPMEKMASTHIKDLMNKLSGLLEKELIESGALTEK